MDFLTGFYESLDLFLAQIILFIPKVVFAYLLWMIGKTLINWAALFVEKLDIKDMAFDDKIRNTFLKIFVPVAKIILVFIILDTFGVGSSIISALMNGLVFTIAITLGLAFGDALKPEARNMVESFKRHVKK